MANIQTIAMPTIDISNEAYDNLIKLLEANKEYTHIRFSYSNSSCCKSSKIDILLDEAADTDKTTNFKALNIIVDDEISEKIKNITLVYKDNVFFVKADLINEQIKSSCSSCASASKKKSCENCSGCKK